LPNCSSPSKGISLKAVLAASGFRVEYLTQFMLPLAPLMWLSRCLWGRLRKRKGADRAPREQAFREFRVSEIVNGIFGGALRFEEALLARNRRLPLGTSLLAVACAQPTATQFAAA
jgi:hypothetical protein